MPGTEDICEVRTAAGIYRDWMSVGISQSFTGADWVRQFKLQAAEASTKTLRLIPEDRVDIALAGEVVIEGGKISDRQAAFDANRHAVQLDGCSKAGEIMHTSVEVPGGGQFRGYTLSAIAGTVLRPSGLRFRVEKAPDGHDEPFPNVAVRHGETPFSFLKRLCRQRGLLMRAEANGDVVAGVTEDSSTVMFEEGRNILSANIHVSAPWVQNVVVRAQQAGSDSLFGRRAAEVSARGSVDNGPAGRTGIVLAEMPLSAREAQLRANMEIALLQAAYLRVTLTYQGWLKPVVGGLWGLTDRVSIKSPTLFPTHDGPLVLRVGSVLYAQDANVGTTTTLECLNDQAYGIKGVDATKADPFWSPGSSPATAEVAV